MPTVASQLAGSKKIQQMLALPAVLTRFLGQPEANQVAASFAGLYEPEQTVRGEEMPAWRAAVAHPERFVLKPQREGGGNNLFGSEMGDFLASSTAETRSPYILMERLQPEPREALMVMEGELLREQSVSEIGRFGTLLADGEDIPINRDVGYLVRTKPEGIVEGGVSAGFGYLDSLVLKN